MEKVMADPCLQPATNPMPFDGKRMIYGGFEIIVEACQRTMRSFRGRRRRIDYESTSLSTPDAARSHQNRRKLQPRCSRLDGDHQWPSFRIVANIAANQLDAAKAFYGDALGMNIVMNFGWI